MFYIIENGPYPKEHIINNIIVSDFKSIIEKSSFPDYLKKTSDPVSIGSEKKLNVIKYGI